MSNITKKSFFEMLNAGNVIGFEKEVADIIKKYLDSKLDDEFIFSEHNYRIGEGFENLVSFLEFKDILATTELEDINDKNGKCEASKYHEYKALEKDGDVMIISSVVIVVVTPDVEPYYEIEAKLYVFNNVK